VNRQQETNRRLAAQADASLAGYLSSAQQRVVAAESAVEEYRQSHHLVSIGGTNPIGSSTLQSQSLSEANTELSSAAAELAMKQGQLQQVQQLIRSGQPLTAIAPVLQSPVVQALVEREADADSTLNDLRTRLGEHHPDVAGAEARSQSIHAQLEAEVQKNVSSLSTEVASLAARKGALARRVNQFETVVSNQSADDVKLGQLEREAQAEAAAYETINTKTKQIAAEQLVQRSAGQIVVEAIPADVPSSPKKKMIIAGTFLASLGLGTWLAVLRKMMSRYFDGAEEVESETGLPVLGRFRRNRSIMPQELTLQHIPVDDVENAHGLLAQICSRNPGDANTGGLIVLVTSSSPGEGKSSFATTLGQVAAQSGIKAMLLDNDAANSFGTMPATSAADAQLTKTFTAQELLDLAETERSSGLRSLRLCRYFGTPKGILAWTGLQEYLGRLRTQFQLTIVDVASVLSTSDALRFGALADRRILLIDTRQTTKKDVLDALTRLQRAGCPATATVLTESSGSQHQAKRSQPADVSLAARARQSMQPSQA
jgi:succinoglycan biosynthesis transport protein ExoP